MGMRRLYIARHGEADPFGELTPTGLQQADLLGERLARHRIDAVWHSPLARAAASAQQIARHLQPGTPVAEAAELVDTIPYVPSPAETPAAWVPFFDGDGAEAADAGHAIAARLTDRFATAPAPDAGDVHEVLITHAYPIAWLVRDALDAPAVRWLGLNSANTALTVIEYRPALPAEVVMVNDMSHLPPHLRWTGFSGDRP